MPLTFQPESLGTVRASFSYPVFLIQYFSCAPEATLVASWRQRTTYMGQLELLVCPTALKTWHQLLTRRALVHFIDNDSAASGLVRWFSPQTDWSAIIGEYWSLAARYGIDPYIDRIESKSNLSDEPSRFSFTLMISLNATRVQPFFPDPSVSPICHFLRVLRSRLRSPGDTTIQRREQKKPPTSLGVSFLGLLEVWVAAVVLTSRFITLSGSRVEPQHVSQCFPILERVEFRISFCWRSHVTLVKVKRFTFLAVTFGKLPQQLNFQWARPILEKILETLEMQDCRSATAPGVDTLKKATDSEQVSPEMPKLYRRVVGQLLWLSNLRCHIMFAFKEFSKGLTGPTGDRFSKLKQLAKKKSQERKTFVQQLGPHVKLPPPHKGTDINCYVDSDWAGNPDSRKSNSGVSFFVLGTSITAHSRTQEHVALSSGEAELYAIGGGVADPLFVPSLVAESRLVAWQINGGAFRNFEKNKTCWT